jgi:hypothetical protein
MQRSVCWFGVSMLLGLAACGVEGVGDPCTPEAIPVKSAMGGAQYGFEKSEAYIESSSVQCRSRLCIVNHLDNGTNGTIPADPRVTCEQNPGKPGCVAESEVANGVHCTCKCGGPETVEHCKCPQPFVCLEILTLGGDGIKGSYCVKPGRF